MQLDIGAAECPICWSSDPDDWITLDLEGKCAVYQDCDKWPKCKAKITTIADANHLPFRDRVFELARSSSCVLLYTEDAALIEMMRVADIIQIMSIGTDGIHILIDTHKEHIETWRLTEITELGYDDQLFDTRMERIQE